MDNLQYKIHNKNTDLNSNDINYFNNVLVDISCKFNDNVNDLIHIEILLNTANIKEQDKNFVLIQFNTELYKKLKNLIIELQNRNRHAATNLLQNVITSAQKYSEISRNFYKP